MREHRGPAAQDTARVRVDGLQVVYPGPSPVTALAGVDVVLAAGRCLCVLGESGSGKSTLGRALLGLLFGAQVSGRIRLNGVPVSTDSDWNRVRWRDISIALPSGTALNPVVGIGEQIAEPIRVHLSAGAKAAAERAGAILEQVGLGAWAAERYPHELSTGQRRLAMIAMALSCDSPVMVLDEPTAGLDPATRRDVLSLLARLRDGGRSLLVLTHDVPAARLLADDVAVLYRGWIAEHGPAASVLDDPRSPYAFGLLNANSTLGSVKDLRGIRGTAPDPGELLSGCPFATRCTQVIDICTRELPPEVSPVGEHGPRTVACHRSGLVDVLQMRGIGKSYLLRHGLRRVRVPAVVDVDLTVREGEVVGLVGRNGAGKSTFAQIAAHLAEPDTGAVWLQGSEMRSLPAAERKQLKTRVQMLFPDPVEAVSARLTVKDIVREPLDVQGTGESNWRDAEVARLLTQVGLPAQAMLDRHAHEVSTGQLQRVALARALALAPKLLVADEPVECLDPSERAKVLQLLKSIQVERGLAMLLISHDLSVVLRIADRVAVMDAGRIVEFAPSSQLLHRPAHPTTRALLEASGADPASWPPLPGGVHHAPASSIRSDLIPELYSREVST